MARDLTKSLRAIYGLERLIRVLELARESMCVKYVIATDGLATVVS
jgi:hypothetical protein